MCDKYNVCSVHLKLSSSIFTILFMSTDDSNESNHLSYLI